MILVSIIYLPSLFDGNYYTRKEAALKGGLFCRQGIDRAMASAPEAGVGVWGLVFSVAIFQMEGLRTHFFYFSVAKGPCDFPWTQCGGHRVEFSF